MLKFEYSKYTLRPLTRAGGLTRIQDREGAIFRITWPNGKVGYADFMPRSELGDLSLDEEIDNLKRNKLSLLMEQTIALAKIDGDLRADQINAFKGAKRVKNNFFLSEITKSDPKLIAQIKGQNFTSLMIDCGQDFEQELDAVRKVLKTSNFLVRLDFNAKADFSIFERFMTNIEPGLKPRIEYVEDPMPFEPESWREAAKLAPLAAESQYAFIPWNNPIYKPPVKALVIRPSRIDVDLAIKRANQHKLKIVVTSSLEHPVAIAHSTMIASNLINQNPTLLHDHDCLYQTFYAPHHFSGSLTSQGPFIVSTEGMGIGFDSKFRTMTWTPLK